MFKKSKAVFLYCVSPVHMGAGASVGGLIDSPIQRERHTEHPLFAGSGLKGAVRHDFWSQSVGAKEAKKHSRTLEQVFGPETNASTHAGAISFSDAQLLAFPVRSLKNAFVYITCPAALARAKRSLLLSDAANLPEWPDFSVKDDSCRLVNVDLLRDAPKGEKVLTLEAFDFVLQKMDEALKGIADWLAQNALPENDGFSFFREKLSTDLVMLSDTDFSYFVKNATVVEPHVRIDDLSGTAQDGGLFYTENLPPESLLLSTLMASDGRHQGERAADWMDAEAVMNTLVHGDQADLSGVNGRMIQIGGDASTGRGQVIFSVVEA